MAKFKRTDDEYDSNIHALLRFLGRTGESGYTFAIAQHEGLIPAINSELLEMSSKRGKKVQIVAYEDPEDNDITFAEQLRRAAPDAEALIVTGLDRPLRERPYFIDALNFSREAFHEIGKPILFWLTQESLAYIGNRAVDFYTQRSMMTVEFEHTPEINAPSPELERRFRDETYRSKEDYEALKTRVNLLKKQLAEALEAEIPRRRIAQDIALPLANTYSELDLHEEAVGLLEQFEEDWDEGDAEQLYERGVILAEGRQLKEAIACLENARMILERGNDLELLADVQVRLGDVFQNIGQIDFAKKHYEIYLQIGESLHDANPQSESSKSLLAVSYDRLGGVYETQGKLDKALELFGKSLQINEELHTANPLSEWWKNNLAISYGRLGRVYKKQVKLVKALEFFEKDLQINEELHTANPLLESVKNNLGVSYGMLGEVYETLENLGMALEFFEKALQINEELHAANPLSERIKHNLGVSYCNLGEIYKKQRNLGKALYFFEKYFLINEDLHAANPLSEWLKNNLAASYYGLGEIYQKQGKLGKALNFFEKNLKIREELHVANPASEWLKNYLCGSYYRLSGIHERLGNWRKSIYYCWKEVGARWRLCHYVGWRRYKQKAFASTLNLIFKIIIPTPISTTLLWIENQLSIIINRLHFGRTK